MRMLRLALLWLVFCSPAFAQVGQIPGGNAGGQFKVVSAGGGCTTTTFGQDGTPVGANASASSVTTTGFSTTNCNNLVIAGILTNAANVVSVTDAQSRLTFTKRASTGTGNDIEIWTAPLSGSPLSGDAITVNVSSGAFTTLYVNSISGYKTSAPFDPSGPNINTTGSVSCSWTTTNANDIIYGFAGNNGAIPDTGFTLLSDSNNSGWFDFGEFQVVTSTQSGLNLPKMVNSGVCDAIQKGP